MIFFEDRAYLRVVSAFALKVYLSECDVLHLRVLAVVLTLGASCRDLLYFRALKQ